MKKRVLLLIAAVMVVFAMMPSGVHAESKTITDGQGIKYTLNDSDSTRTASISGHTDALPAQIVIPATVKDSEITYAVTSIGENVFLECKNLSSIMIPSGVKSIGKGAFVFSGLSSVTFESESKLETIGNHAFSSCQNLSSIMIPSGVKSIGESAFAFSGISSVTFESESKLETIGNSAFLECKNLSSIMIPSGVKSIGESTFFSSGLSSVTFESGTKLETIGNHAFVFCKSLSSIMIPSGVKSIGEDAFDNSGLTLIHYIGDVSAWNRISFGDRWMPDPDNPPAIHYVTYKTVKATPDKDGYTGYTCDETGCSDWEYEKTVIRRPAKFSLNTTSYPYNGSARKPVVTVKDADGKVIASGNYDVAYSNNVNPGKATAAVIFKGNRYSGRKDLPFTINKSANPLKIKAKTVKVKYKKLKKKAQKLAVSKVITFTKKGKGRMSYRLSSAKKGKKKCTKFFKIKPSTGKITIRKGLKKGTYKVTVKVKAAGNVCYKASTWKKLTFMIKVQ